MQLDAFVAEIPGQGFRDFRFAAGRRLAAANDRDLHAHAGKHLRQLGADVAAADDEQRFRQAPPALARRCWSDNQPPRCRGSTGTAGRAPVAMMRRSALMRSPLTATPSVGEPRRAFEVGDAVIGRQVDRRISIGAGPATSSSFWRTRRCQSSHARLALMPAKRAAALRLVQRLGSADQRLRRHAADVDAGAADRAVADRARLARPARPP